jgi:tRNA(fMet)-specific endonuclease VapC
LGVSRLLLDTSAYSAFIKGRPEVVAAVQTAELLFLNPVVVAELLAGFGAGRRRADNESGLEKFLASPRSGVVDIDQETANRYALILNSLRAAGTPIPTNDVWIAASAMQHGLEVLTCDAHYGKVPQIAARVLPV